MTHSTPGPAALVLDMTAQVVAAAESITDPVARIHAINEAIYNTSTLSAELATLTKRTVREMTKNRSYSQIAQELGISKTRVGQLAGDS